MKNTFFRLTVAAALLAVGAIGCAPLQQSSGDDYYDPAPSVSSAPSRIWVDDPYRPGATILMERDPYSGRYYPVQSPYNTYGGIYTTPPPYSSYDPYYRDRSYGRYRGSRRGGYNRNAQPAPTPQQQEQVRREGEQRRERAADAILGKKQ
jgi:hypothetical protein